MTAGSATKKPRAPRTRNMLRHPKCSISGTMTNGPETTATWTPMMNRPLARDRSLSGNHRLTIALDIGKWIPSATPSKNRSAASAMTVAPNGAFKAVAREKATTDHASAFRGPNRSAIGLRIKLASP